MDEEDVLGEFDAIKATSDSGVSDVFHQELASEKNQFTGEGSAYIYEESQDKYSVSQLLQLASNEKSGTAFDCSVGYDDMLAPGDMMVNEENISETKLDETVVDCATVQATPPPNAIEEHGYHLTDKVEVQELHPPPKPASLIYNFDECVGSDDMLGPVGEDQINFDTSNEVFQDRVIMMTIEENISDKKNSKTVDARQLFNLPAVQSSPPPNGIGDQNPHPTDMVEYLEPHPTPK
ncbi:hypothetical protein Tco_1551461, partial [Tanacetum coccineum]